MTNFTPIPNTSIFTIYSRLAN